MPRLLLVGIFIITQNGLFHNYLLCIGPWAEDFLSIFRGTVVCMKSYIVGSFWNFGEGCSYSVSIVYLLNQFSIFYRTHFAIDFLHGFSENKVIACCVCRFGVSNFYSVFGYFYACDCWLLWCDGSYNEWVSIGPVAEYFLTIYFFPSVAVCVVGSLLYIFECSRGLNLILVYGIIIFVCDAVAVCRDYLVVTCSTFGSTRKDYSRFVANNFNTADH